MQKKCHITKQRKMIMMSIKCKVFIQKEDNWYVATDIVSGVASQGKTIDESLENLKEALLLYSDSVWDNIET